MQGPTKDELKLQKVWTNAAIRAEATGVPPLAVSTTMFAAACERLTASMGHAGMAQYLG